MQINAMFASIVPGGGQVVAVGAASAASTAMNAHSGTVRLVSTVDCFVEFGGPGTTPVAAANTGMYLPAFVPEYFYTGPNTRVAVIQSTGAGSLYISQA